MGVRVHSAEGGTGSKKASVVLVKYSNLYVVPWCHGVCVCVYLRVILRRHPRQLRLTSRADSN